MILLDRTQAQKRDPRRQLIRCRFRRRGVRSALRCRAWCRCGSGEHEDLNCHQPDVRVHLTPQFTDAVGIARTHPIAQEARRRGHKGLAIFDTPERQRL